MTVFDEVLTERWWRFRCGEPMPNAFPTRCHRDLLHPSPHVGLPTAEDGRFPSWPGVGHKISAHTPAYRCWCTLRREGTHWTTWKDPRWPADTVWLTPAGPS